LDKIKETTRRIEQEDSLKATAKSLTLEVVMLVSIVPMITDHPKDPSNAVKLPVSKEETDLSVVMVLVTIVDPKTPTTEPMEVNVTTPKVVLEDTTGELKALKSTTPNSPKEDPPPSLKPKSLKDKASLKPILPLPYPKEPLPQLHPLLKEKRKKEKPPQQELTKKTIKPEAKEKNPMRNPTTLCLMKNIQRRRPRVAKEHYPNYQNQEE